MLFLSANTEKFSIDQCLGTEKSLALKSTALALSRGIPVGKIGETISLDDGKLSVFAQFSS